MCGYSLCRNCKEIDKTNEHKCYMLPKDPKTYTEKYIFFIMKLNKIQEFTGQT
jgi:hypothetical protein